MKATSPSKFSVAVLLCLSLFAPPGALPAQQPQSPEQDEVIKVDTALVQLHAVVTDRKGQLVDNLKQEDFAIYENGTPQELKFFSLEHVQSRRPSSPATATNNDVPAQSAPPPTRRAQPARTVVLFVDTLHLSPASLLRAKQQLRQFVDEQLTDDDLAAVIVPTGSLGVLQQFMRDRTRLKYAISKISPFQPTASLFSPYLAAQILNEDERALNVAVQILAVEEAYRPVSAEATREYIRARAQQILGEEMNFRRATLQTLAAISERLAGMKGQRMIAYVSDGFTLADSGGGAERQDLRAATSRAVRAGVLIYTFNAKGLSTPIESQASTGITGNPIDFIAYMNSSEQEQKDVLREIADETGARAYLNRNDLHNLLNNMLEENRAYYSLAYYPQDDKDKKKFRKLKVQVKNHPEYSVRVQNGYQPAGEQKLAAAATPQQALMQAMSAPLPATAIGVNATTNFLVRADDDAQATVRVHIDGDTFQYPAQAQNYLLQCELVAFVLDQQGKIATGFSEEIKAVFTPARLATARRNGFRYERRLNLKPGLYQVRVGVRETSSGFIGTAVSWLEVPDLNKKRLALSGIFLWQSQPGEQAAAGAATTHPAASPQLLSDQMSFKPGADTLYRFVVYNTAPLDAGTQLKVEIMQGDAPVYAGDWQPLTARLIRNDVKGAEVGGQFKATLSPGFYTLRVSVKDTRTKKPVQQTVDFEITS